MTVAFNSSNLINIVAGIGSSSLDYRARLKSICQVAHERLRTHSITCYELDQKTGELHLIAMSGVLDTEWMRGPANTPLLMHWLPPMASRRWLHGQEEFSKYMAEIRDSSEQEADGARGESDVSTIYSKFRSRASSDLVTVKCCLYKSENRFEKVGQVYLNFEPTEKDGKKEKSDSVDLQNRETRETIDAVVCVIREVLIGQHFHKESAALVNNLPSGSELIARFDGVFASQKGFTFPQLNDLQQKVVRETLHFIRPVLEGWPGFVDLVLLEEPANFGLSFQGTELASDPVPFKIERNSLTSRVVELRNVFQCDLKYIVDDTKRREIKEQLRLESNSAFSNAQSVMYFPVMNGTHVMAVVRIATPQPALFRDIHADYVQEVLRVARYALLRVVELKNSQLLLRALHFHSLAGQPAGDDSIVTRLNGLIKALNASYATYWPVWEGMYECKEGYLLNGESGPRRLEAGDSALGIRMERSESTAGFTELAYRWNADGKRAPTIVSIHFWPSAFAASTKETQHSKTQYLLRGFTSGELPSYLQQNSEELPLHGSGFHEVSFTESQAIPFTDDRVVMVPPKQGCELENSRPHTRLCLVIRDLDAVVGVIWIVFDDLRPLGLMDRRFLDGVVQSLYSFQREWALNTILLAYRHNLRGATETAIDLLQQVETSLEHSSPQYFLEGNTSSPELADISSAKNQVSCPVDDPVLKTKAVLASLHLVEGKHAEVMSFIEPKKAYFGQEMPVSLWIDYARILTTKQEPDEFALEYESNECKGAKVRLHYYIAMYNLLANVVVHGISKLPKEDVKVVIHVSKRDNRILTCVAHKGHPLDKSRLVPRLRIQEASSEDEPPGVGLRVVRKVLAVIGGEFHIRTDEEFKSEHKSIPDCMNGCNVVASFYYPLKTEAGK